MRREKHMGQGECRAGSMKNTPWRKAGLALGLWAVLLLSACGGQEQKQEQKQEQGEFVYVQQLLQGEKIPGKNVLETDDFHVTEKYLYYLDGAIYRVPIGKDLNFEDRETVCSEEHIDFFTVDQEDNVYYWIFSWNSTDVICKRSADGELLYRVSLEHQTPYTNGDSKLAVDSQGNLYALASDTQTSGASEGTVLVRIDKEGNITGRTPLDEDFGSMWQRFSLIEMPEGIWFLTRSRDVYEVAEGDVPQLKAVEGKLSDIGFEQWHKGLHGALITKDDDWLYCYRGKKDSPEKLLRWQDSDIYRNDVRAVVQVTEDCLLLVVNESKVSLSADTQYLVRLVRTPIEEVPQKERITIATLGIPRNDLEIAAVRFNRISEQYHVSTEGYGGGDEGEARLDISLASKDAAPDLVDLWMRDVWKYAETGALEDLRVFMGQEGGIREEDYLTNLLEGYTIDGRLVCIPKSFRLESVYVTDQRAYEAGDWSMDSLLEVVRKYPEVRLIPNEEDSSWLMGTFCAPYYLKRFIDWESGACHFDSEEFRELLEWGKSQIGPDSDSGTSLLKPEMVMGFDDYQESLARWREKASPENQQQVALRGLPSADGKDAYEVIAESVLGIAANSAHKEGAWEFLRYYLLNDVDIYTSYGSSFPTRVELLDQMAEAMVTPEYETDQNGKILTDGNGDPIEKPLRHIIYSDGEEREYFAMERWEIDALLDLLGAVDFTPRSMLEEKVISIVTEEAEAFFGGNRTMEEVTKIIQNRVQVLVQENQ